MYSTTYNRHSRQVLVRTSYPVGISSKELDVVPDPDQRHPLVPEALIPSEASFLHREKPEGTQTVVHTDGDNVIVGQEVWGEVGDAGSADQGAAVKEDLHGGSGGRLSTVVGKDYLDPGTRGTIHRHGQVSAHHDGHRFAVASHLLEVGGGVHVEEEAVLLSSLD